MKLKPKLILVLLIIQLIILGCSSSQTDIVTPTPQLINSSTHTPAPTSTTVSTATVPPTPQPTEIGGSNGFVIYDDHKKIFVVDLKTGERKVLLARAELETMLPVNRSKESNDRKYSVSLNIDMSPDMTKAYTYICTDLDDRYRCIDEHYIYDLPTKTLVKLDVPSGENSVYWKWSPDGSMLAGPAWVYDPLTPLNVEFTTFYAINADGSNLKALLPVVNQHTELAWHPSGNIVYPMTFLSGFKAISLIESKIDDVVIEGLKGDDRIECLDFSSNSEFVVFAVTRETQKGYYWVYSASDDFSEAELIFEFDSESRYGCEIELSPNGEFVHLNYRYKHARGGSQYDPLDIVFDFKTGEPVDIPKDSRTYDEYLSSINTCDSSCTPYTDICGWSPDNNLVYSTDTVKVKDLLTSTEVALSRYVGGCSLLWAKEDLSFELSDKFSIPNACHPGTVIVDDQDVLVSELFDILEIDSSLNGEILTAKIKLRSVSENLSAYLNSRDNDGWFIYVDVDNNVYTGDYDGFDYVLVANVWDGRGTAELFASLYRYSQMSSDFIFSQEIKASLSAANNMLTIGGWLPGINQDSRLFFTSHFINSNSSSINEQVCH